MNRFINPSGSESDDFDQYSFLTEFDNLLYLGTLHFAPESEETASLIEYLNRTYATFSTLLYRVHKTESKAVDYILDHLEERTLALIVLKTISVDKVSYKLRLNYTTLPNTNEIVNDVSLGLDTNYQKYFLSGFLTLKDAVDSWVYNYTGVNNASVLNSTTSCSKPLFFYTPYPTPSYDQNIFYPSIGFLLGLALTMSTLYPVSRLIKAIVEEKESQMKELMTIMGLYPWVHNISWCISAFILFFWIAASSTFISSNSFFPKSNKGLLFAYFFFFCMSEIAFCFIMSLFFDKSKIAAIVGPVALFAALLPRFIFIGTNSYEQASNKYLASVLSPSAFAFGADILSAYEYSGEGVQMYNLNEGDYSFNDVLRLLLADAILYSLIALYLSEALSSEFGTRRHAFFFLDKNYWVRGGGFLSWLFGSNTTIGTDLLTKEELSDVKELCRDENDNEISNVEPLEEISPVRVLVSCLRKRYTDGKLALKNLSFAMIEGQITCLLGHNGAGKSTTMSILTGIVSPTSGDSLVYGRRITCDMPIIRQMIGYCPQKNVLFPNLTVMEHLIFFGKLKRLTGHTLYSTISQLLIDVGLSEKKDVFADALSGGMKRKLCLAIALIGNPKFLLLDEPTSGMDPYSRRAIWDILQKYKLCRTVLLTTHFMDEADILGDRIVILANGKLKCSGTGLFLKNTFGAGYLLSLAKRHPDIPSEPIISLIQKVIDSARVTTDVMGQLEVSLPLSSSGKFTALFSELESEIEVLGVNGYGVSIATLEEVFLSLAAQDSTVAKMSDVISEDDDLKQVYVLRELAQCLMMCVETLTSWFSFFCKRKEGNTSFSNDSIEMTQHTDRSRVAPLEISIEEGLNNSDDSSLDENVYIANECVADADDYYDLSAGAMVPRRVAPKAVDKPQPAENSATFECPDSHGHYSKGSFRVQFQQIIEKRIIIQSRDGKGLFFQVIFPALQILMILAVLTIDVNPAGGSLELDANTYNRVGERPTTLFSPGLNESLGVALEANEMLFDLLDLDREDTDFPGNVSLVNTSDSVEFPFYTEEVLSNRRQDIMNISDAENSTDLSK